VGRIVVALVAVSKTVMLGCGCGESQRGIVFIEPQTVGMIEQDM
jgi:hypothetical protein